MTAAPPTPPPVGAGPTPSDIASFYDRFHNRLMRDRESGNPRLQRAQDRVRSEVLPGMTSALEIGCGVGSTAAMLATALGKSGASRPAVTGVDISPNNIAAAAERYGSDRVRFAVSDLSEPPLGGPWDLVVMVDVYEHLPAAGRAGYHDVLSRCLADDGVLVLTVPSEFHQAFLREYKPGGLQVVDETVTAHDMLRLAEDVGGVLTRFEMVNIWFTCDYVHAVIRKGSLHQPVARPPIPLTAQARRRFSRLVRRLTGRRT